MDTIIFNGKEEARKIREGLKKEAAALGLRPTLAVILVGDDPSSLAYVKRKQIACEELDFGFSLSHLPANASVEEVMGQLSIVNSQLSISGVVLQLPLPSHLSSVSPSLTNLVSPEKDIDGLIPNSPFTPPVALAVLHVLRGSDINIENANTIVCGRGQTAGKPIARLLEKSGAKVTVIHSQTSLSIVNSQLLTADIVVSCVGRPNFIKGEMIKNGAVVIGVGINRLPEPEVRVVRPEGVPSSARSDNEDVGRDEGVAGPAAMTKFNLVGDLDEPSFLGKASLITPTPGGIGPLTVAFLLKNLLLAAQISQNTV